MPSITRRAALLGSAAALMTPALSGAQETDSVAATRGDQTESLEFTTHRYATKDGGDLFLDLIVDPAAQVGGSRPVIMYMFGGGWEGGDRGNRSSVDLWREFLALGYAIVAIDYRLGVKVAKDAGEFTEENGTEMYLRAIQWSVEDLFDATSFVLDHASEWNLDPNLIVTLGGSSGATNSLVAEYHVANATELAQDHLPTGFRYAGVISMAGAFWLPADTPLAFASKPAPIMFFHGGKDQLVTYDEVQGGFSGYGPVYYFREFAGPQFPKWFVDYPEGDHVLAALPLTNRKYEMRAFLERMVRDKEELSIHTEELSTHPSTFEQFLKMATEKSS